MRSFCYLVWWRGSLRWGPPERDSVPGQTPCSSRWSSWSCLFHYASVLAHDVVSEECTLSTYLYLSALLPDPSLVSVWSPGLSSSEGRQSGKSPSFSVNWSAGDGELEVVDVSTGRKDSGTPSRLCKRSFFSRWERLHHQVSYAKGSWRLHPNWHPIPCIVGY